MAKKSRKKKPAKKKLTGKRRVALITRYKRAIAKLRKPLRRKQKAKYKAKIKKLKRQQNAGVKRLHHVLGRIQARLGQPLQLETMGLDKAPRSKVRVVKNADGSVDGEIRIRLARRVKFDDVQIALQEVTPTIKGAWWKAGMAMKVPPSKMGSYQIFRGMARMELNWRHMKKRRVPGDFETLNGINERMTHWPDGTRRRGYRNPEEIFVRYRLNASKRPRRRRRKK